MCRRVEVPIVVVDFGAVTTVLAETPMRFTAEVPDVTNTNAKFEIKCFPFASSAAEGEIYIFAYTSPTGERWDSISWARYGYQKSHPRAQIPELPETLECVHGLTVMEKGRAYGHLGYSYRMDFRGANKYTNASRDIRRFTSGSETPDQVSAELLKILRAHLDSAPGAKGPDAWRYKQRLAEAIPSVLFWNTEPGALRAYKKGKPVYLSLSDAVSSKTLNSVVSPRWYEHRYNAQSRPERLLIADPETISFDDETLTFVDADIAAFSKEHRHDIFANRAPQRVTVMSSGHIRIEWSTKPPVAQPFADLKSAFVVPMQLASEAGGPLLVFTPHKTTDNIYDQLILNADHPFVQWLIRAQTCCEDGLHNLTRRQFDVLLELLASPLRHAGYEVDKLASFLKLWNSELSLPSEIHAPHVTAQDFQPQRVRTNPGKSNEIGT